MIKLQQSQALTSHFESFWSIVYLNFLATCSKNVQFSIDLWKNHPNILDFFAKAIFSQTLKVFLTERVRRICGGILKIFF